MWAIFDLCAVLWYLFWSLIHSKIPFYSDIFISIKTSESFGLPGSIVLTILTLILYLSLLFSAFYLLKKNIWGAIICYIQSPFRLFGIPQPSIFFILWFLKYFYENPPLFLGIFLLIISEVLKLTTIILWHKRLKYNISNSEKIRDSENM